jgi:hypothetical protein
MADVVAKSLSTLLAGEGEEVAKALRYRLGALGSWGTDDAESATSRTTGADRASVRIRVAVLRLQREAKVLLRIPWAGDQTVRVTR